MSWKRSLLKIIVCSVATCVVAPEVLAQNEIAWQLGSTSVRPLDPDEPVLLTNGYALVGVGENAVGVYDAESGALIRDITLPAPNPIERRTFAAENGRLLVADTIWVPNPIRGHSRAYAFDIASGRQLSQLQLPDPTLRVGVGASLATDGHLGLVSSISCFDTCDDEVPVDLGVVDVFDLATGQHRMQIVSPDDALFAQGLAIDDGVIAISARSRSRDEPGRVQLVDATTGAFMRTITPDTSSETRHHFGFNLALEGSRLAVGENPAVTGGVGGVSIYDVSDGSSIKDLEHRDVRLSDDLLFGSAIDLAGPLLIAGAPRSDPSARSTATGGVCAESFISGACRDPIAAAVELDEPDEPREPSTNQSRPVTAGERFENAGATLMVNIQVEDGILSKPGWLGGDSVAISDGFGLVLSVVDDQASVYAISLNGFFPPTNRISAAGLQTRGDLDGSGEIGFTDFLTLSENYGSSVSGLAFGDLDSSGEVNFPDFLVLSENYGQALTPTGVAAVPEPDCSWLFLLIGLATIRRVGLRER